MPKTKKLEGPITLFATIEARQHERLREIAYEERRSMADVVREAIEEFLKGRKAHRKSGRA